MANYKLVNADQLDTDLESVADKIREKAEMANQLAFPSGFIEGIDQCSSLNFSVVGGTTQPSAPKENTIWVNTSRTITSWVFSVEEPSNPTEGMVWFSIGNSSNVSFNALKKNAIQVYPLFAQQYTSGAWVDVTAMSYQDGAWADWCSEDLYYKGDQCKEITGGWKTVAGTNQTITFGENMEFSFTGDSGRNGSAYTVNKVDLSGYTKIIADIDVSVVETIVVGISSANTEKMPAFVAKTEITTTGTHVVEIELPSSSGSYYVAVQGDTSAFSVSRIRIIKKRPGVFTGYLYYLGDECETYTGGWKITNEGTKNSDSITIGAETDYSGGTSSATTQNPVDLTGFNTVTAHFTEISIDSPEYVKLNILDESKSIIASNSFVPADEQVFTNKDISVSVSNVNQACYVQIAVSTDKTGSLCYAILDTVEVA